MVVLNKIDFLFVKEREVEFKVYFEGEFGMFFISVSVVARMGFEELINCMGNVVDKGQFEVQKEHWER